MLLDAAINVFVKPSTTGRGYVLRTDDEAESLGTLHFDREQHDPNKLTTLDPYEYGLNDPDLSRIGPHRQVNLYLPNDPVACLDWERLSPGNVVRRIRGVPGTWAEPVHAPLRVGVLSTQRHRPSLEAAELVKEFLPPEGVELEWLDALDWPALRRALEGGRFDVVHLMLDAALKKDMPCVLIGGTSVSLRDVVHAIATRSTRFAILDDDAEDRTESMAPLRWGAQSLPPSSHTSLLLRSGGSPSGTEAAVGEVYRGLFRDETLTVAAPALANGTESIIGSSDREPGLELAQATELADRRIFQLAADIKRYDPDASIATNVQTAVMEPKTCYGELLLKEDTGEALKTALREIESQHAHEADASDKRYPVVSFYHPGGVAVLPSETLWKKDTLELHFWLDVVPGGILSRSMPAPSIVSRLPYPLDFDVLVWSEHVRFTRDSAPLRLHATGPTEHAVFPVEALPDAPGRAIVFLFMMYDTALVGAFRIDVAVNTQPPFGEDAQTLEYAYLSNEWFNFEEAPGTSALTIFVDKRPEGLSIFGLAPKQRPWYALSVTESDLYAQDKGFYRALQLLAHEAEAAERNDTSFTIAAHGTKLAQLGREMFGLLFYQAITTDLIKFHENCVEPLPDGSALTIALSKNCEAVTVPWGLLYDMPPPVDYFDASTLRGFWGYRFNLTVRPHVARSGSASAMLPVRMGSAWLIHTETKRLAEALQPMVDANQLRIEPMQVVDHALPDLATGNYDLIQFYCHGYTKIPNLFSPEETNRLRETYQRDATQEDRPFLMVSASAMDSLIEMAGGTVTLTELAYGLKDELRKAPIILLSMCGSAQFTSSGTGFVPLFLRRGARAVIGTEGPTLWTLAREMDTEIIRRLLAGQTIGRAFYETRREFARTHALALIYTLYGDAEAKLVA
ncbi:MAG: CHAT domain-containing protein [Candidatus Eremiobacteraeota bacterium]|nr:CHAT domain-containing protein [Candidatus Eremiobacteraeota bacterium]